ncbi:MAG: hybrid sensor histidine kinase/response regulator [Polyangiaceae bacterium]
MGRRESTRPSAIAGPSRSERERLDLHQDVHQDVTGALHDVSNSLTVLLGWVSEARAVAGSQPAQLEHALAVIESRARSARDLARRAIGAASPVDDRDELLDTVVGDVVDALRVEASRAGVSLVVARQLPGVRIAHASDAAQVLTNMLLNALEWTPARGRVRVETTDDGSAVSIAVDDEGPGIAADRADHIFDGVTTREEGAGVGLRHARNVARAAGGELELVSGPVASGARFRLRWPRLDPAIVVAPASAPRSQLLTGKRILVVEDDDGVATLLETALGARGAEVAVARNASEVAERARASHDVALVDLSPIADDVHGAIQALRRGSPDLALVFISGSAAGLPQGFDDESTIWVRKPFEIGEILAALSEARAAK